MKHKVSLADLKVGDLILLTKKDYDLLKETQNTSYGGLGVLSNHVWEQQKELCFIVSYIQPRIGSAAHCQVWTSLCFSTNLYLSVFPRSRELEKENMVTVTSYDALLKEKEDTTFLTRLPRVTESTGFDPEIFLVNKKDEVIPAFNFFPEPLLPGLDRVQSCFADGFAAEFTTIVIGCHAWGVDAIRAALHLIQNRAKKYDASAKFSPKSLFAIPPLSFEKATDTQVALGCAPSSNIYGHKSFSVDNPRTFPFRSAGGHIHFGVNTKTPINSYIRTLDRLLGIPCVALFDGIDDPMRRTMYGRAGEYRSKPYGLEYRVLSNAWILSPIIAHLVLNTARGAMKVAHLVKDDKLFGVSDEKVQEIINTCDAPAARKYLEKNWGFFSNLGTSELPHYKKSKFLWLGGLRTYMSNWDSIEKNWHLEGFGAWSPHSNHDAATWEGWSANCTDKKKQVIWG